MPVANVGLDLPADEHQRVGLLIVDRRLRRRRRGLERLACWTGAARAGFGARGGHRRRRIVRTSKRDGHQSRRRASHKLLVLHQSLPRLTWSWLAGTSGCVPGILLHRSERDLPKTRRDAEVGTDWRAFGPDPADPRVTMSERARRERVRVHRRTSHPRNGPVSVRTVPVSARVPPMFAHRPPEQGEQGA